MAPIQMILLLLIVLFYSSFAREGQLPAAPAATGWFWTFFAVVVSHLVLIGIVAWQARRAARRLHQPQSDAHHIAYSMDRLISIARWTTVVLAAVQIWGTDWGPLVLGSAAAVVTPHFSWNLGRFPLVAETVFFLPPLLSWLCFWAAHYRVERSIRERALAYRLALGLPTHEMPSLGHYLLMQSRHNFFLLVPMAIAILMEFFFRSNTSTLAQTVSPLVTLALFIVVPWLITRIWSTTPMTGDLRARLQGVAHEHRVRFRNILLWKTHNHVSNAAILGYLPFARYFLMSDALLESLTDRQIEAVFAHEVGHGRHRHIWWYMAAFAGAGAIAIWIGSAGVYALETWARWHMSDSTEELAAGALQVLCIGLFFVGGFSWISKRFEHQADWFAAQHMAKSLSREPERLNTMTLEQYMGGPSVMSICPPTMTATTEVALPASMLTPASSTEGPPRNEITFTRDGPSRPAVALEYQGVAGHIHKQRGAAMFSSALGTVLQLSHRSVDRGGWLHPSCRDRANLLSELAASEEAVGRFEKKMLITRCLIVGLVILGGVALMNMFDLTTYLKKW